MDKFLFDFYNIINKLVYYINNTDELKNHLYYSEFLIKNFDNNIELKTNNIKLPIIFCLGGMGYKIYEKIINEQNIDIVLETETFDYDFSFALKNNNSEIILLFENKIKTTFYGLIENYSYTFDKETINKYKLKKNINKSSFDFISEIKHDRLHIKINLLKKKHILELSFWFNGKVSDEFTINDFNKNKIFIYTSKNLDYYLLPLNLLVKTTFYAILDFLENRNYNKCYKYIQRIEFIKKSYDKYVESNEKNHILEYIFDRYNYNIRKKYKIIIDYPFILAKESQKITNDDRQFLTRCIHHDLRKENIIKIKSEFITYKEKCEKKVNKNNIKKYTENSEDEKIDNNI